MSWLPVTLLSTYVLLSSSLFLPEIPSDDEGELFVVIVVGISSIYEYPDHADACHTYQVLKSRGIQDDHIILLMDNVVVNNPENPYPGKLYNHPSLTYNVYLGCVIDYNTTFTPETLKNVLIGNDTTGGPVLKTTERDRIFFYFTDHGDEDVMFLPDEKVFTTADMDDALRLMTEKKMYKEMLFYIDCCYAGSIFEKVIPKYENILVITSSSPHQSAANTYCINDTGICLGAEFSVAWLEYDDTNSTSEHTLRDQLEVLKKRTTSSNVSVYGDVSILDRKISAFQGVQLPSTPVVRMDDVQYEYETVPKPEIATWRVGKMLERAIEADDQQEVARLQSELVKLQNAPWP